MKQTVSLLDTTLRDGAQGEGVSFSVSDKCNILQTLDAFGIPFVEAGAPGSNPKDMEFFRRAGKIRLQNTKLCAFGSTLRKGLTPQTDKAFTALLAAETPVVSVFGKASLAQALQILGVSAQENLRLVRESIAYLKMQGRTVFFDAEHYFDAVRENSDYALEVLRTAADAGADALVLCDTNGGCLPWELTKFVAQVKEKFPETTLGIHCHNDAGCAVANSLLAVRAGVTQVQGSFAGLGERCGNADLSQIIPALELKCGYSSGVQTRDLYGVTHKIAQLANVFLAGNHPYVGQSAFAHKGGMHIDGLLKQEGSFEHIRPGSVGNSRRFLLSEYSGKSTVYQIIHSIFPHLAKDSPETERILKKLKAMEHEGYQFEAADASFELLVRRTLGKFTPHFEVVLYRTMGEYPVPEQSLPATATVQLAVDGKTEVSAALGKGPVNALDSALRRALTVFYPEIGEIRLTDYKVRVLEQALATQAKVRVLIETQDANRSWTTVGVSDDIIKASFLALVDSMEYKLLDWEDAQCKQPQA